MNWGPPAWYHWEVIGLLLIAAVAVVVAIEERRHQGHARNHPLHLVGYAAAAAVLLWLGYVIGD